MSCRIDRNKEGQITNVYDSNGNESIVYNQLVQVPGNTPELALEQYLKTIEPDIEFVTTPINNGLTSHMFMLGEDKVGTIRTKPVEGGVKVDQALVTEGYRGQGVGTELYLETIRNLMAEGKKLFSDTSRTAPAERIWEKLVESGLAIKKEDNTYETILVEGVTPETTIDEILKTIENGQTRITELGESGGDRTRWNPSRGSQTLEGAPVNTKRKNVTGADPELTYWAEEYARRNGIDYRRQSEYVMVDVDRAMRIAQAYEDMPHAPQDPTVKEAYENLIKQTIAQYNILVEGGYQFYFFDETNDPYDGNPLAAMEELRNEKRMGSFATEAGFGTGNEGLDVSDNPMLADTGLTWGWGSVDGPQKRVLANDLFRAVHDAFGHGLEGAGFRARGEENAWQAHARLFTGSAVGAITSETRGQNSWLNFGKYGEQNRTAKVEDTVFAPQKTGLMPEWTWKEGFNEGVESVNVEMLNGSSQAIQRNNGNPLNLAPNGKPSILYQSYKDSGYSDVEAERLTAQVYSDEFMSWFGDWINDPQNASKVVDENGQPMVVYHGTSFRETSTGLKTLSKDGEIFSEFKRDNMSNEGFYFAKDKKVAELYATITSANIPIYEVFLNIRDMSNFDAKGETFNNLYFKGNPVQNLIDAMIVKEGDVGLKLWNIIDNPDGKSAAPKTDVYVTKNSNQIKSAINNNGQFSSENPNIYFKVGETTVNTYRDALKVAQGQDVQIGVLKDGEFIALETRSSNTNPSTKEGWINNAIVEGIVKETQYIENGVPYLEVEGYSVEKQLVNDPIVEEFAYENNMKAELRPDGTFQLVSLKVEEDFPSKSIIEGVYNNMFREAQTENTFVDSDSQLVQKITTFLEKLGFSLTTIEAYSKKYLDKNGTLPNAEALVDLANQVVAFKDGKITEDSLSEEFAHIMLEALPQAELTNMLSEVHNTQEWAENYQTYMDIYQNEDMVRKEVLGKILAKGLQNKTNSTNLFQQIWSAVQNFINRFIKSGFQNEISDLTDRVHDMLIRENVSSLEDITKRKFRMYRVDNTLPHLVQRALEQIHSAERQLNTAGSNKYIFNEAIKNLEKKRTELAAINLIDYARRAVRYVQESKELAELEGKYMSSEELVIATQLKTTVADVISKVRKEYANDPEFKGYNDLAKEVADSITMLDTSASEEVKNNIINRILNSDPAIGEKIKPLLKENQTVQEYFEAAFLQAESDTNFMHSMIGSIAHAKDALLSMLNIVNKDMVTRAEFKFFDRAKDIIDQMKKSDIIPSDFVKLFDKDGYVISKYDFAKYQKEVWKAEEEVLRLVGVLKQGDKFDNKKNYRNDMTEDQVKEYAKHITLKRDELIMRKYKPEYYEKLSKRYEGLDEKVVDRLKQLELDRIDIMRNVKRDSKGRPIYTKRDKLALEAFNIERKKMKSFYSDSGELKLGATYHSIEVPNSVKVGNGYYTVDPSLADSDTIIAFGLNEYDKKSLAEMGQREYGVSDHLDILENMSASEARDFIQANINFGLKFDDSREEPKIKEGKEAQYENYKKVLASRSNLLNKYRDPKNGANILFHQMNSNTQRVIRDLTDTISELRKDLFEDSTFGEDTEFKENEAYRGALKDLGIAGSVEAELDFVLQHIPSSKKNRVNSLLTLLEQLYKGNSITDFDKKVLTREFENEVIGLEDIHNIDDYNELRLIVAKKRIAPYFTATVPKGVTDMMEKLSTTNSVDNMKSILRSLDKTEGMQLSMHYSYYDNQTVEYNEDYDLNFIGAPVQPKFLNTKFDSVLGLTPGTYTLNELGIPSMKDGSSLPKMAKAYEIYINTMHENLKKQSADGMGNVYLAPQISSTTINKLSSSFSNPKNIGVMVRETVEELKRFRVDELEIGEVDENGESLIKQGVRVVPRRFINPLENSEEVSDDLFNSMMLMTKESEIHKSRKEALPQFMAIEESAKHRKYNNTSKEATSTNTYKMLKSSIDYNLFGVSEVANYRVNLPFVGAVDLAKISRWFHKYIRNKNLAYNLIVPITSLFTAEVGLIIERYVKEYVDPNSYNRAFNELNKLSPEAFKEGMELNREGKISVLAERFGMFDLMAGYENSKFGPFTRLAGKIGYIFHTAANYSPLMKAMLGGLMGHRLYDGRFLDFEDYNRKRRVEDSTLTSKAIKAEWAGLANSSFYDFINVKDGKYIKNYERFQLETGMSIDEATKLFDNTELDITLKVQKISEAIDGNIRNDERTQMQRHFLLTFLFTHKGWMSIALARRFKTGHYNTSTKKFEEGHYITAGRALKAQIKNLTNIKDLKKFQQGAIDSWEELSPEQKRNMTRILVDFTVVSLLYAIVLGMTGYADDDENKDNSSIQLLTYLMERTLNETRSSQIGLGAEVLNTIQDPVVGFKELRKSANLSQLFDTEEVQRGRYKGLSGSAAYLLNTLPGGKSMFTISSGENINYQRGAYRLYNSPDDLQILGLILDTKDVNEAFGN